MALLRKWESPNSGAMRRFLIQTGTCKPVVAALTLALATALSACGSSQPTATSTAAPTTTARSTSVPSTTVPSTTVPSSAGRTHSAQQWETSLSFEPGDSVADIVWGSSGITATYTVHPPGKGNCQTAYPITIGSSGDVDAALGTNASTFQSPEPPAGAVYLYEFTCYYDSASGGPNEWRLTLNKPLAGPILHVINLDGSYLQVKGTSTTGAAIGLGTPLAANNELNIKGNTLNSRPQPPKNPGCELNDGSNPAGGCGSVLLVASSGLVRSVDLDSFGTGNSQDSEDGWYWSLSFPILAITGAFNPRSIHVGKTSKLTLRVANPGPDAVSPVAFADALPTGLTIANETTSKVNCGSGLTVDGPGGAGLAAGQTGLSVAGAAIPPGRICRVTVDVTTTKAGAYVGRASGVTSSVGNVTSQFSDSLTVKPGSA